MSAGYESGCRAASMWEWPSPGRDRGTMRKFATQARPMKADELVGMECWTYSNLHGQSEAIVRTVGMETEDQLKTWLQVAAPANNMKFTGGYKIVHMFQPDSAEIPIQKGTFAAVRDAFGLPPLELYFATEQSGAYGMFRNTAQDYIFICANDSFSSSPGVVIRYELKSNMTSGYVSTATPTQMDEFHAQYLGCSHPILIPVLMIEMTVQDIELNVKLQFLELQIIEKTAALPGTNYQELIKMLGDTSSNFWFARSGLQKHMARLNFLLRKLSYMDENLPATCKALLEKPSSDLRQRIEWIMSSIEQMLMFGGIEERIQNQQTMLLNLMAQVDNQLNIGLAKDSREIAEDSRELAAASKQDSSAMKIIAVLTTLFLPGAFIAALLSMPILDWSQPKLQNVATPYIWVYGAIAIPLTIATMIIVGSWTWWRTRRNRKLYHEARSKAGSSSLATSALNTSEFYSRPHLLRR